jgi:hypothetical protein
MKMIKNYFFKKPNLNWVNIWNKWFRSWEWNYPIKGKQEIISKKKSSIKKIKNQNNKG